MSAVVTYAVNDDEAAEVLFSHPTSSSIVFRPTAFQNVTPNVNVKMTKLACWK